jgi:hypothetical protein
MANLYWQDSGSQGWSDVLNWWTDADATAQALNAPWVDGVDTTYLAYDLTLATGASNAPTIDVAIGTGVTGTCDIDGVTNDGTINDGTFSGDGFTNSFNGTINDGTFSGDGFNNYRGYIYGGTFTGSVTNDSTIYGGTFSGDGFANSGSIYDGTFSGDGFNHNLSTIYGGTFTGSGFTNSDYINGGTFSGDGFTNNSSIFNGTFSGDGFTNNSFIYGGTFEITGFTNSGSIAFPDINVTSGGTPYTGDFLGQIWLAGDWVSAEPFGTCYYTNASGDKLWSTLSNWNSAADGSGVNPTDVPWTVVGGSTIGSDLVDATGGAGITINAPMTITASVTGTCNITGISVEFSLIIDGGTFTGAGFSSYGTINGGTFSGSGFYNGDYINGGTFSGASFTNAGYIYGGTFTGAGFGNTFGSIYGGTFSGSGFSFSGIIGGGTFLPQAISVTTSEGNTLLSIVNGPTFAYPTPASGGGSDQTIARLLNLPWFINL